MPKEWILNSATNRFQLNFKRNVGATSEAIRLASPKTVEEWRMFYYANVRTEQHIEELGKRLYIKITEVMASEIEEISERDCIDYIKQLVIERTFDGYIREIKTIHSQLHSALGVQISAAPDDWDRKFNVDFFVQIKSKYIGIQIKPVTSVSQIPQVFKEHQLQLKTHQSFLKVYGGRVFYVYSCKKGDSKIIVNEEVIQEIKSEINRLEKEQQ